MRAFFRKHVLKRMIWWFYRLLISTWKIDIHEPEELLERVTDKKSFILAHWHGDELGLLILVRRYRLATMTSTSRDGELINFVVQKLGGTTARGSSTRGGVGALKALIRLCRNERRPTSFAVDGPRGPIYEVKPGIFELSKLTRLPIFAMAMQADNYWTAEKSWNKAKIPKPFSRVQIVIESRFLPALAKDDNPKSPELAQELKSKINLAKQQAIEYTQRKNNTDL